MEGASMSLAASRRVSLRVVGSSTEGREGPSGGKIAGVVQEGEGGSSSVDMGDWGVRVSPTRFLHTFVLPVFRHVAARESILGGGEHLCRKGRRPGQKRDDKHLHTPPLSVAAVGEQTRKNLHSQGPVQNSSEPFLTRARA